MVNLTVRRSLVGILVVSMFMVFSCNRKGNEDKFEFITEEMSDRLDLDAHQQEQLKQLKNRLLNSVKSEVHSPAGLMDVVINELEQDTVDEAHLKSRLDEKLAEAEEIGSVFLSSFVEFHGMLTPEQRIKLVKELGKLKKYHNRFCRHDNN
ncbi:MAG: hypothetical protein HKM93_05060 [Desulfobacteraceae bacterium]|nr:hypothetical protein [Desulfobacteraceae bacterium]